MEGREKKMRIQRSFRFQILRTCIWKQEGQISLRNLRDFLVELGGWYKKLTVCSIKVTKDFLMHYLM